MRMATALALPASMPASTVLRFIVMAFLAPLLLYEAFFEER
jgi:hypothetical protein